MDFSKSVVDMCPDALDRTPLQLFLVLINTLMMAKCYISDRSNYPDDYGPSTGEQFDFVVIGGGSAGSVVASRLTEDPNLKILLIEAGDKPSPTSEVPTLLFSLHKGEEDWQYSTEPDDSYCKGFVNGRCLWPRGKALGGSSTINAMLYVRGNQQDYQEWVDLGNDGWDYPQLLSYFQRNEHLKVVDLVNVTDYGENGPLPLTRYRSMQPIVDTVIKASYELGYEEITHERIGLGYFEAVQTINSGTRANAAKHFLADHENKPNLHVTYKTKALELIWEDDAITGVEIVRNGKKMIVKAQKEIVLSAGAINTPQLLMLSGIGPKKHLNDLGIDLKKDLPVGLNLQDHLIFVGLSVTFDEDHVSQTDFIDEIYDYVKHQRGKFAHIGISNFLGFINTKNPHANHSDVQYHHILYPKDDDYLLPTVLQSTGMQDKYYDVYMKKNREKAILMFFPTLLKPKSRGKLELQSRNHHDKPRIHPKYLDDQSDYETMLDAIEYVEELVKTKPFRDINAEFVDLKIDECTDRFDYRTRDYWGCVLRYFGTTIYHPVGTAKMGHENDSTAVVNSRLQVHGVKKLRVIDASIMPTITSGNTNAPSLMIGQKGAAMILEDWK